MLLCILKMKPNYRVTCIFIHSSQDWKARLNIPAQDTRYKTEVYFLIIIEAPSFYLHFLLLNACYV